MVIFDRFDILSTTGNSNEYSAKQIQTVSLQPNYVSTLSGKTKTQRNSLPQCFQFAESRSLFHFFAYLLENSFSSLLTENLLHSHGSLSKIYL